MKRFCPSRRLDFATAFFGIFMLAIMAGCVHVETQTTTTCPSCCGKDGETAGCYPTPYTGSAYGFWDDATNSTYTGTKNCVAGSSKCLIPAGRCADTTPCKSRVNNSSAMVCKCDCKP
jgi:hypothetical protein